jgi:hypothetical protein
MSCTLPTTFLHVNNIGDTLLMSELETNIKTFFDWAFLGIGGWFDVNRPTSGIYGGEFHKLRAVEDPQYTDGQVWETVRKDWVWETGVEYSSEPIHISGVYLDDTLYATGDATYAHHYNYPLGRVVFDSAIPVTTDVQMNYSYRWLQTYVADEAPWWQELQYGSTRPDDLQFDISGSGEWGSNSPHRVQFPAIVLECVPRGTSRPFEIGNNSLILEQDMLFHALGETRHDRNQIVDILRSQTDRTMWLFDSDKVARSGIYPLDYQGSYTSGKEMYPGFIGEDYRWKRCRWTNAVIAEVQSLQPTLHEGTVRVTFEVIVGTF